MLTLEKFEEASEIVKNVTLPTKLVYSENLSQQTGGKVYLKPENMQYTELIKCVAHIIRSAQCLKRQEQKDWWLHQPETMHRVLHTQHRNSDARLQSLCQQ